MKQKPNIRVIIYSLIAIACLVLTFIIDWLFIIPAAILMFLNQKELLKEKNAQKQD